MLTIFYIIELYWDYDYYQAWTDNKWIIKEIIAIKNKRNKNKVDKENYLYNYYMVCVLLIIF